MPRSNFLMPKISYNAISGAAAHTAAEQAAVQAAKQAAEQAAKQTAEQAAKQTAKDAAEQGAKQAAKQGAKDAAEQAAKQTAQEGAEQGAEQAAKQTAKEGAEQGAEQAAKQTAKDAAEQGAKDAAKQASEKAAKDAAEQGAKDAAEKSGKKLTSEQMAVAAAAAAAAGLGLYTYIEAEEKAGKSNNTPRGITKITKDSGTKYNVFFTPDIPILMGDTLVVSSSNTAPTIDGPQVVSKVVSSSEIVIDFGVSLTKTDPGGSIKVTTTASAQGQNMVRDAASTITGAGSSFLGGALDGFFQGLGLDPSIAMWVAGGLFICCIMVGLFFFLKK